MVGMVVGVTRAQSPSHSITSGLHPHPREKEGPRRGRGQWGPRWRQDYAGAQTVPQRTGGGGGGVGGWGGEGGEAEAAGGLRDALSLHAHLYPDFLLHFLPLLHLEGL